MSKDEPTNSELKIMLDNLIDKSDQRHLDYKETHNTMIKTLKEILEQAQKTNGRVNRLEWWKMAFVGALGAVWTLILIVLPLLYKSFYKNLDYKIQTAVVQAVDNKIINGSYEE